MTKPFWIFGAVYLIVLKISVTNAQLVLEDTGNPDIQFEKLDDATYVIRMNEEMGEDVTIAYITTPGTSLDTLQFHPSNGFEKTGMITRETDEANKFELIVMKNQDYESDFTVCNVDIFDDEQNGVLVHFYVENVDDHPPILTSDDLQCTIKEKSMELPGCEYKISDDDRNMDQIKWKILGDTEERYYFDFVKDTSIENQTDNEIILALNLKKPLDYQNGAIYIINLEISDTNPSHTSTTRIVINVEDIPDLPPVWNKIFQSQRFDEHSTQKYTVQAVDGDIGRHDNITYELTFNQNEDWSNNIKLEQIDENGVITVTDLDRDVENGGFYNFIISACEVNTPFYCIAQNVTFILNDINDNVPVFTIYPPPEIDNVIELVLPEETATLITQKISVNDIDSGENAIYTLKLTRENQKSAVSVAYENAFSFAPESGYQNTSIDFIIKDYTLLDYDNQEENWKSFTLTLSAAESTDQVSDAKPIPITFNITLINRNDNLPTFQKCNDHVDTKEDNCVIAINETFNDRTNSLVKMIATDDDVNGTLTYEILGSYANSILKINENNGSIFINPELGDERPFDFEILPEVIVQVKVTDHLDADPDVHNSVFSQLTIKLIDENDETPKISTIITERSVDENCGYCVTGIEIVATDDDFSADLDISIDWENSSFIKNDRKLTEEEYKNFKDCVEFAFQDSATHKEKRAKLRFRESNPNVTKGQSPDFETFDTLDLRINATDKNQSDSDSPNFVTTNVQIYIKDLNDNIPYFTNAPYDTFRVTENSEEGTLIGYITAIDDDVGTELTYTIKPKAGTPDDLVKLIDGILTTTDKSINADMKALYYIVTVTDEDPTHIATAEVTITIDQINQINH